MTKLGNIHTTNTHVKIKSFQMHTCILWRVDIWWDWAQLLTLEKKMKWSY